MEFLAPVIMKAVGYWRNCLFSNNNEWLKFTETKQQPSQQKNFELIFNA